MKILLVNKFYYRRGGDCIFTINLENMLKSYGHKVAVFAMQHPDTLQTSWSKYFPTEVKFKPGPNIIEAIMRPFGTTEVKKKFNEILNDFQPDIVHLNNIHSQISPIIAQIAKERGIRVVWTLHDLKLVCPRYDCRQNGEKLCNECFTDKKAVLRHRCMKNSLIASFLAYLETKKWNRECLEACTDLFICPSEFIRKKMLEGGFKKSKLITLCNFINTDLCKNDYSERRSYFCYVGRLSYEKGIDSLIHATALQPYTLKLIGDGPIREDMEILAKELNAPVEFIGHQDWNNIKDIVSKARFNILPSIVYENNPLTIIESLCLGTPVLGANIGGIPELISSDTGMTFESGNVNDMKDKIDKMFHTSFDYKNISLKSQEKYNSEKYYNELIKIYTGNYGK